MTPPPGGDRQGQNGSAAGHRLTGKSILLVEDEPIVAMSLEDMLLDFGCNVVGPALRLSQGLALAQEADLDAAILDVNMREGFSFGIAAILVERRIPFCFSTGYGTAGIEARFSSAPVLQKPYSSNTLAATLLQFLA